MNSSFGRVSRVRLLAASFVLFVSILGCSKLGLGRVDYAGDLIAAIGDADRITVTQHSYRHDAHEAEEAANYRGIIYAKKELSPSERAHFTSVLRALPTGTPDAVPGCIFNPHHSFHFYKAGKLASTMQVCFECAQVKWDGTNKEVITALHGGLREYVAAIGMQPEADWHALAIKHGAIRQAK